MIFSIRYYLSERFRLRMEDAGLEEMMDDQLTTLEPRSAAKSSDADMIDEGIDVHSGATPPKEEEMVGYAPDLENVAVVRTLDGEEIDDEFAQDAMNYQILLGKIDGLLDRLKLDA